MCVETGLCALAVSPHSQVQLIEILVSNEAHTYVSISKPRALGTCKNIFVERTNQRSWGVGRARVPSSPKPRDASKNPCQLSA